MPHLPVTADYIDHHAARNPRRAALVEAGGRLSYAELALLVRRCAQEMQAVGVRRGMRVAVSGPGLGLEMVVLLAAEALGAATASFDAADDDGAAALWPHVDWVFTGVRRAVPEGVRLQVVDQAFAIRLRQPVLAPPPPWTPVEPGEGQRLVRALASAGTPKLMLLSRAAQDWWIRCAIESWQADQGRDSRVVLLCPMVVNGGFMRMHAVLRQGGAVIVAGPQDLARMQPTSVFGLPVHVERLLRELPADFTPRRPVSTGTVGGLASVHLREHAAGLLGGPLFNRYGTSETGPICDELAADGTGAVRPGVEVRILDGQGRPARPGEQGVVAVRSPGMVDGYLGDEAATAAAFRGGWFLTGDAGEMLAPRMLRIAGRHDDVVNLGGFKAPAALVSGHVDGVQGVAESAVLAVVLPQGQAVGVALVLAPDAKREDVVQRVQQAVRPGVGATLAIACLPSLPRLAGGSVDRQSLLRIFRGG